MNTPIILKTGKYYINISNKKLIYVENDENKDLSDKVYDWEPFKRLSILEDGYEIYLDHGELIGSFVFNDYPNCSIDVNATEVIHVHSFYDVKGEKYPGKLEENHVKPLSEGINDGGERISYGEGLAVREPSSGKGRFDLITPFGIQRLARWYELGAQKYSDRNWEKGIPFSRYIDSASRHLNKFIMGMTDEDHLAAAAWNILAIMHHQELGQTDLDDMPHYLTNVPVIKKIDLAEKKEGNKNGEND